MRVYKGIPKNSLLILLTAKNSFVEVTRAEYNKLKKEVRNEHFHKAEPITSLDLNERKAWWMAGILTVITRHGVFKLF